MFNFYNMQAMYIWISWIPRESGTGQDGDTASVISDKLEFMTKSQEYAAGEPDSQSSSHRHHNKAERAMYSKVKHTAPQKEDVKKMENSPAQDTSVQDDTGN